jgi:spermidine/putrescine transport system substrate-binding protein
MTSRLSRAPRVGRRTFLRAMGASAVAFSLAACGREEGGRRLNFYTWDTYIGETTLDDFRQETGVRINASYFATNDELFAKLRAGNPGYDVVVPTNEFVTRMIQADMLTPLDMARIPNFANIAPEFQRPDYDTTPPHSVPYTWLVMGIGYRKSRVQGVPDSWKWLFDSDLYAGRIALLTEAADLIRLGARYLGHSIVGVDDPTVQAVADMLGRQKANVKTFHEDNGQELLLGGDVDLVLEYNGDIAQVMAEDDDLAFVVPQEGSILNTDTLVIPKGAPNPELAHRFINFLLDAEVGKHISETILYPTPNAAAKALMPESYSNHPAIFPTGPGMERSQWGRFEGPERQRAFEDAITRMRAA